ncbi:MAG: 2-oxo acid dehydrogenase subunit E2 [Clostridia bacterium]|nr:2-oxo acid dehydrogenase subunit E2 [Clostridia bacterium]
MSLKEYMKAARLTPDKNDKVEYMSMREKMMCNVFVNSQRNIPPVTCIYDADVTKLTEAFNRLRADCGYKLTLNTLIIRILVEGLKAAPRLNAHYQYNHFSDSGRLVIKKNIDLSMAVCTKDGATHQVKLRNLENKSLREISDLAASARERLETAELDDVMFEVSRQRILGEMSHGRILSPLCQSLSAAFGKGKVVYLSKTLKSDFMKIFGKKEIQPESSVKMEEMNEGTVCITNWGSLYDKLNVEIVRIPLLYPQVFLLGVGRLRTEKYAYEDENGNVRLDTKQVLPLSLNFDHKIGGASELIPFIKKLDEILEDPEVIYNW